MERKKRCPSGTTSSEDTVLVQIVAEMLPHDSPEFQERAKLPRSARGPSLALYHELQEAADAEQLPRTGEEAASDDAPKPQRKRSPFIGSDAILFEFTDKGDTPLDHTRERNGRPERSPSLPPLDEPKSADDQPPA